MEMKVYIGCLLLSVSLSYGAVIPPAQDALFDMAKSFISSPEAVASALGLTRASALGLTRVRRGAGGDKAFSFAAGGVAVDMNYLDENQPAKGGKFTLTMNRDACDKLTKMRGHRYGYRKITMTIDFNNEKVGDNLFNFVVTFDTESDHFDLSPFRKGTFTVSRTFDGKKWITTIAPQNLPELPSHGFSIVIESDYKTVMNIKFLEPEAQNSLGRDYSLGLTYTPSKKIELTFKFNADAAGLSGELDMKAEKVLVKYYFHGYEKYDGNADISFKGTSDEKVQLKGVINTPKTPFGPPKQLTLNFHSDKYLTDAGLDISMDSKAIVAFGLKGILGRDIKYELRYNSLGSGEGKIRFRFEKGEELKFDFLPKDAPDFKILANIEGISRGMSLSFLVTRDGKSILDTKSQLTDHYDHTTHDAGINFSSKTQFIDSILKHRIGDDMEINLEATINERNPARFKLNLNILRHTIRQFGIKIDTIESPFEIFIDEPFSVPFIYALAGLPKQDTFKLIAEKGPGAEDMRITSSLEGLNFSIKKIDGSNQREILWQGKRIILINYSVENYKDKDNILKYTHAKITCDLPYIPEFALSMGFDFEGLDQYIKFGMTGLEKHDVEVNWNRHVDKISVDAKGSNYYLGTYEFQRKFEPVSVVGSHAKGKWTGTSLLKNGKLTYDLYNKLSFPVETKGDFEVNLDYPFNSIVNVSKTSPGMKFSLKFDNGKISVDF